MYKLIFAVLFLSLTALSCKDDNTTAKTGSLKINFKAQYDGKPLVIFDKYTYPNGAQAYFTRFSFFLSDLSLANSTTSKYIEDVLYQDMTPVNANLAGATAGTSVTINNIEAGTYSSLNFGIGVNSANNAKTPAAFTGDNPLSGQSEYWGAWKSYIFAKTEGFVDMNNDNVLDLNEEAFSLHLGSDGAYTLKTITKQIAITDGGTTEIDLIFDIKNEFVSSTGAIYDIAAVPATHSLSLIDQIKELATNLNESLKSN